MSSQSSLESNRLGYEVGVRINIDVLNAEQQLATASRDLMQARYVALVSRLRLYALSGMEPDQAIAEVASAFEP